MTGKKLLKSFGKSKTVPKLGRIDKIEYDHKKLKRLVERILEKLEK